MKPVVFVTSKEFDPFTAGALNARFNSFLARFCAQEDLDFTSAMEDARDILRAAEIPQAGDELMTAGCEEVDLTPFNTEDK